MRPALPVPFEFIHSVFVVAGLKIPGSKKMIKNGGFYHVQMETLASEERVTIHLHLLNEARRKERKKKGSNVEMFIEK